MTAPTVSVSASVQREVTPDSFTISVSVSGDGDDAAAAAESLATRFARLEGAVAGLDIDVRREPVHSWHDPGGKGGERVGWRADRSMTLTGRDVTAAGDVLAAVGGLADAQVAGPAWHVHEDNPVHAELQADAVHEARARAERYAAALGGALGRLVQLNDPGSGAGPRTFRAQKAAAGRPAGYASMQFDAEPLTVHATVEATWQLVLPE